MKRFYEVTFTKTYKVTAQSEFEAWLTAKQRFILFARGSSLRIRSKVQEVNDMGYAVPKHKWFKL